MPLSTGFTLAPSQSPPPEFSAGDIVGFVFAGLSVLTAVVGLIAKAWQKQQQQKSSRLLNSFNQQQGAMSVIMTAERIT